MSPQLPPVLQALVDRMTGRTTTALTWPATGKVKRAFTDTLADLRQLADETTKFLPPVP